MKRSLWTGVLVVCGVWSVATPALRADEVMTQVTGKAFDSAFVGEFYLEGNAIPTQKRNAAIVQCNCGKKIVVGLLDTTGYSAEIQKKYVGMMILEKKSHVGMAVVPAGSYGFGLEKPEGDGAAKLIIYDVGGSKVGETEVMTDADLKQPVPLQVMVAKDMPAKLYLGRHWVELK